MPHAVYDVIGGGYDAGRQADPRIRDRLWKAIGAGSSVVNVGAGTGAYEPVDTVLAVEPSQGMIDQRSLSAAPVVRSTADAIPLADACVDVALVVLTIHHWPDLPAGIKEMCRVANRVVILTWDQDVARDFWLTREYLPQIAALDDTRAIPIRDLVSLLGGATVTAVPIPHDCADGFLGAYWRRPESYLDPTLRAAISAFALIGADAEPGLARLADDVASGAWNGRHRELMDLDELDLGYRILST